MPEIEYKDYGKKGLKKNGKPRKGFWKTKDGRVIKISDMGEQHLRNSMRVLERMAYAKHELEKVLPYLSTPWPNEETMAFVAVQQEFDAVLETTPEPLPQWQDLLEEANRRGIEV